MRHLLFALLCLPGLALAQSFTIAPVVSVAPASAKLTWAAPAGSSCIASGSWTGSKATSGTLTVTNVTSTAKYTLTCSFASVGGSATLTWQAPTTNTDGSALTNLDGYKIKWGTSAASLTNVIDVTNPAITTYIVEGLTSGLKYFALFAYNSAGVESGPSNVASKNITAGAPTPWVASVDFPVTPQPTAPVLISVEQQAYRQNIGNTNQSTMAKIGTVPLPLGRRCVPTYDPKTRELASVMGLFPLADRTLVQLDRGFGLPMQVYVRCARQATAEVFNVESDAELSSLVQMLQIYATHDRGR